MILNRLKRIAVMGAFLILGSGSVVKSADEIRLAPDFEIPNLAGDDVIDLQKFQGKVVYVDFWASWCGPCLKSFPFMEKMHTRYSDDGLVIIAINMDQKIQDAHDFLAQHPVTFLIGQDAAGKVAQQYGVIAMPSSFVVDRDGLIKDVHYGFKSGDKEKISSLIEELL